MEYNQDFKNYNYEDDIYADLWNSGYGNPLLEEEGEIDIAVGHADSDEFYGSQLANGIHKVYVGEKYAYIVVRLPDFDNGASNFDIYPISVEDYYELKEGNVESIPVIPADHPDFKLPSRFNRTSKPAEPEFDGIEIYGCRSVRELEIKLSGLEAMTDIYHRTPHFPRNGTPYDDQIKKIKRFLRGE